MLREYAPDDPTRTHLKQLVLDLRSALNAGLPLRGPARRALRPQLLEELGKFEKAFGTAALLLSGGSAPTKQAVADIVGFEMARLLTDEAFEDAGVSVDTPSSREFSIIRSRAREPERAVAEEMRSRRSSRARRSAEVLSSFLARCHALLAAQMEIERGDKGGRPSHPEREYVLANLAFVFEDIFGRAPTSSETGKYVSLSSALLELLGLETQGVEPRVDALRRQSRPAHYTATTRDSG